MEKRTKGKHGWFNYYSNDTCIGRSLEYYGEYCELEIDLIKTLIRDEAVFGDCFAADSVRYNRPRYFQIRLDAGLELPVLLETLAHEIVHLRQYAKDQLYEYRNGDSRYAGKRYPKNSEDLPWEDEAHALEQHIYHRYTSQL